MSGGTGEHSDFPEAVIRFWGWTRLTGFAEGGLLEKKVMKDTEKRWVTGWRLNVCQSIKGRGGHEGWMSAARPPEADDESLSPEAETGLEGHPGQELVRGPRSLGRLLSRVVPSQICMIFQLWFSFALT